MLIWRQVGVIFSYCLFIPPSERLPRLVEYESGESSIQHAFLSLILYDSVANSGQLLLVIVHPSKMLLINFRHKFLNMLEKLFIQ